MEIGDCHTDLVHPEVLKEHGEFLLNHLVTGVRLFTNIEILLLVEFSLFIGDIVLYLVRRLI